MDEIVKAEEKNELVELSEEMLARTRESIKTEKTLSVPIGKLGSLGTAMASLMPTFTTVTTSLSTDGLFRVANASPGDALKMAKNGNAWGALKTANGASKMAQFSQVDSISATTRIASSINPATLMIAVALYSIEKELTTIEETQKKILTFLEIENESQIEADVESLLEIAKNYKYNWDNDISISSSHQLVTDIKNRSRKNVIAYQKKVEDIISSKKFLVTQGKVKSELSDLEKKFKYYRLSLYTLSFSSLLEIMLSGNFKEEYILSTKEETNKFLEEYHTQYKKGYSYLDKLGSSEVGANVLKGVGIAGKSVGKLIGKIPLVKNGKADEFLIEKGGHLENNSAEMKKIAVKEFASVEDPGIKVFVEKMEDMNQIYNHTEEICLDKENIYLLPKREC